MDWNVAKTLYGHITSLCNLLQGDSKMLEVIFDDNYNNFGAKKPNFVEGRPLKDEIERLKNENKNI